MIFLLVTSYHTSTVLSLEVIILALDFVTVKLHCGCAMTLPHLPPIGEKGDDAKCG